MIDNIKKYPFEIISILFLLGLFVFNMGNSFFWDTIQLGSQHANYYYKNNFSKFLLPNSIDSGHIPAFGIYIASVWKIFGRNLIVSHLAMLPFILGIVWQLYKLICYYFSKEYVGLVIFLILIDPTLLSQTTLISPDVPLVFFFLLSWNSILNNRKILLLISTFFLFLTSMRGMMVSFCLLIIDINKNINFKVPLRTILHSLLKRSIVYIPSILLFISFSTYHYLIKGWIGFHDDSPWSECFERVGFSGFLVNLGILVWRILDFGRIGIWLIFSILLVKYKFSLFEKKNTRFLLSIFLTFLFFLPLNMVWAKNLLAHRYLLPLYIIISMLVAKILFSKLVGSNFRKVLVIVWILFMLSGNYWIYPDKVSQGWDSSLAHLPYYKLRKDAIQYLDVQGIDINEVHSFFPNTFVIDEIELNEDYRRFKDFEKDAIYVLYSNIFNISDEHYNYLISEYELIREFKSSSIYIRLYKFIL
jgi:hypothetical protein